MAYWLMALIGCHRRHWGKDTVQFVLFHNSKMENMAQIENSHVYHMFLVNREI